MTTAFRPVIDLHEGRVKQIVGATLTGNPDELQTNFVSEKSAADFAALYRDDGLLGGHLIMLGGGNEGQAEEALGAYPGGLQVGGGITPHNAGRFLDAGASHVIVTSWLFDSEGLFSEDRLQAMADRVGAERLVVDLSCRSVGNGWKVFMNRWQTETDLDVTPSTLDRFAGLCDEVLVHAVAVEGTGRGIDKKLIAALGAGGRRPSTYAGGASSIQELDTVQSGGRGNVDLASGSALDIFGGGKIRYADCVAFNRGQGTEDGEGG